MADEARINTVQSAWGGVLLSLLTLHWQDVVQTAVLAIIGTTVSFCMSALLKKLYKRFRKS